MIASKKISTAKEMYSSIEFNFWAYQEYSLSPEEKFVIEKYLDRDAKTLEGGTGGGRIIGCMKQMGFQNLSAFDYVPEYIQVAKQRHTSHSIYFSVEDAVSLTYNDCEFEQILYLQQFICNIDSESDRLNALKEAYRILKKGGTAIFSLLNFESRSANYFYISYLLYLRLLRKFAHANRSIQYLPQLKYAGKVNFDSLLDQPPYLYWYKLDEAYKIIEEVNFQIVAIGSGHQIHQRKMCTSLEDIKQQPMKGMLYLVCKK